MPRRWCGLDLTPVAAAKNVADDILMHDADNRDSL
jgi:hypothetical protein